MAALERRSFIAVSLAGTPWPTALIEVTAFFWPSPDRVMVDAMPLPYCEQLAIITRWFLLGR
jgi:hypothetical protein